MAKIKLPKKAISKAAKKRFRKSAGRRMRKDFGRRLMKGFGLGAVYDEKQEKSVRDFRRSMYGDLVKKKLDNIVDEPPLDTPQTEENVSNPDISALNEQLKKVLKTAKTMGLVDKQTQDLTMKQLRETNRAAKETQLEAPIEPQAIPEPQEGSGNEISPLADKMEDLIKAFEDLIGTVEDKNDSDKKSFMDRLAQGFGLGDVRDEYKSKGPRLKEGFTAAPNKSGAIEYRDAKGQFAKPEDALERGYAKKQIVKEAKAKRAARVGGSKPTGIMGRLGGAAKKLVSPVTAAATAGGALFKSGALSGPTSKIAKSIKGGAAATKNAIGATKGAASKGVALTGQGLKAAIGKVAGPKITKALATTGIKSIPVLGAIAGLGFAASRLVDGDFLGAGLDAVSGLAGPVTAIPAMVASLSRDIYSSVFGVQPESDPQFGERMGVVQSTVKGLVEQQMGKKVQPSDRPTGSQGPAGKAEKPKPPVAVKQSSSSVTSQVSPPAPPPQAAPSDASKPIDTSSSSSGSGMSQPSSSGSGGTSAPQVSSGGKAAPSSPSDQSHSTPQVAPPNPAPEPMNSTQGAVAALSVPPVTSTGAQIAAATEAAEAVGTAKPKIGPSVNGIGPARTATTRTGAKGMGNVPDPTYTGVGSIANQLYFSASV